MKRRTFSKSAAGFSLVEIALAIGILAFALASILGALGSAADVSTTARRDTVLASMATQVQTELRSVPFDALWAASPLEAVTSPSTPPTPTQSLEDTTCYFTVDGVRIPDDSETRDRDAFFRCTVKKFVDLAGTTPGTGGRPNLVTLQITFEWPLQLPDSKRQKRKTYASIARY